jgi:hypothetical protein
VDQPFGYTACMVTCCCLVPGEFQQKLSASAWPVTARSICIAGRRSNSRSPATLSSLRATSAVLPFVLVAVVFPKKNPVWRYYLGQFPPG